MLWKSSFWDQKEHICREKLIEFQEKILQKNEKRFRKSPKYFQNLLFNPKRNSTVNHKLIECRKNFERETIFFQNHQNIIKIVFLVQKATRL